MANIQMAVECYKLHPGDTVHNLLYLLLKQACYKMLHSHEKTNANVTLEETVRTLEKEFCTSLVLTRMQI